MTLTTTGFKCIHCQMLKSMNRYMAEKNVYSVYQHFSNGHMPGSGEPKNSKGIVLCLRSSVPDRQHSFLFFCNKSMLSGKSYSEDANEVRQNLKKQSEQICVGAWILFSTFSWCVCICVYVCARVCICTCESGLGENRMCMRHSQSRSHLM